MLQMLLHLSLYSIISYYNLTYPGNKLIQNKGQVYVKHELTSAAKLRTQFNYNIIFEINSKIIDVNIH